jgi:hypothetical protein
MHHHVQTADHPLRAALDGTQESAVCTDNLNAGVAVMKAAQDGA